MKTQEEEYSEVIGGFLHTSRRAIEHITDDKLKESSAAQLAMVSGITIDKFHVATGGASEVVQVKFTDRASMLDYIRGNNNNTSKNLANPIKEAEVIDDVNAIVNESPGEGKQKQIATSTEKKCK